MFHASRKKNKSCNVRVFQNKQHGYLHCLIRHSFLSPDRKVRMIISILHGCMVWIEKSVTRVTDRHQEACRKMPNSDSGELVFFWCRV